MSRTLYFSFGLLISFLLFISCSSLYHAEYAENNKPTYGKYSNNEENDIASMIYPKSSSFHRLHRSSLFHPRANRNSWFRVSSYQHMKPTSGSEEKTAGDNLMRWG